ncbi:hypothetical protein KX729_27575 [Rhizobium sp. XQZ8]|uniref:DUF6894 family protein n=1 Tax=Rhizobium populisoli TaxID=2859785 RepID=UPI001CA5287B|nr:hypothetical protein [Rhizobium populisoli]MBW6425200.1 hypothetical protein [Rhizobium populisoli]
MARFFFDVINGHGLHRDNDGVELEGPDQVRGEVSRILTEIARDELPSDSTVHIQVNVRDDVGLDIYNGELFFRGGWTQRTQ